MRWPSATIRAAKPHSPKPSSSASIVERMRTSSERTLPPATQTNGVISRRAIRTGRVTSVTLTQTMLLLALLTAAIGFGQQRGIVLGDLTWPEAEKALKPDTVVVIP